MCEFFDHESFLSISLKNIYWSVFIENKGFGGMMRNYFYFFSCILLTNWKTTRYICTINQSKNSNVYPQQLTHRSAGRSQGTCVPYRCAAACCVMNESIIHTSETPGEPQTPGVSAFLHLWSASTSTCWIFLLLYPHRMRMCASMGLNCLAEKKSDPFVLHCSDVMAKNKTRIRHDPGFFMPWSEKMNCSLTYCNSCRSRILRTS